MKYIQKLFIFTVFSVFLAGCFQSSEITIFLVSKEEQFGGTKIGCDEYLVPVTKKVYGEVTAETYIKALFDAEPENYGPELLTANGIKDRAIQFKEVIEPQNLANNETVRVYFERNPLVNLAGNCDVQRMKEQITETMRQYVFKKNVPFIIILGDNHKEWECLGDESGKC